MNEYDDMLDLPHYEPQRHARMPRSMRAAQFAPFAALTGYEEAVKETARRTDEKIELDETRIAEIDAALRCLVKLQNAAADVEYFVPDARKSGGEYVSQRVRIKKTDAQKQQLLCTDGTVIPFENLYSITLVLEDA